MVVDGGLSGGRRVGWRIKQVVCLAVAVASVQARPALGASGLTVRLTSDVPLTDPVVLLDDGGHQTSLPVLDNGKQPDVIEGDGTFAATTIASGGEMTVTVQAGGRSWTGQMAAFPAVSGPRDLELSITGDTLRAEGRVAGGAGAGGPNPGHGGAPSGAPAGSPPPVGEGGVVAPGIPPVEDNTPLIVALGVGLASLAALGWWGRRSAAPHPAMAVLDPPGCSLVAEGGWLGPQSPPLGEGVGVLVVNPDEMDAVAAAAVATLSRRHRVLWVQVGQGPGWRAAADVMWIDTDDPSMVGDVAEVLMLDGGLPVAVVVCGQSASRARAFSDQLPESVGGLLLCADAASADAAMTLSLRPAPLCTVRGGSFALTLATDGGLDPAAAPVESP